MKNKKQLTPKEMEEQLKRWGHINDFLKGPTKKEPDFIHEQVRYNNQDEKEGYSNNTNINRDKSYNEEKSNLFKSIKKDLEEKGFFDREK